MKLKLTTSIAALLIATSSFASSYDASRGAENETAAEVFTSDTDGFVYHSDGTPFLTANGTPVQIDLSSRAAGSDDTAMQGVDDQGDITASRGADNATAAEIMVSDDGTLTDLDGRPYSDVNGNVIRINFDALEKRSAGSDDTAMQGVDDEGDITASRGADNASGEEVVTE